jgi:GAF domain-containing protein
MQYEASGQSLDELRRELAAAREQQLATTAILGAISRCRANPSDVFAQIAVSASRLCQAYDVTIHQLAGDRLQVAAHHGPIQSTSHPLVRGMLLARAVIDRRTIHVPDLQSETEDYPEGSERARQIGFHTVLAVPLIHAHEAVGVITLRRSTVHPFSDGQIELLNTFADQAVIAIENTRLFEETQAALAHQTATADILAVISESPTDVRPVFQAIAERARELCKAEIGATSRLEGDVVHLAGVRGPSAQSEQAMRDFFPIARRLAPANIQEALARRAPYQICDVRLEPGYPDVEAAERMGVRSILSVPLLHEGRAIGTIGVARGDPGHFADEVVALLETFARQAVIAIENTRLFEAEQASKREVQESLEYQTAISEVLSVISRSPSDLHPVLETIGKIACRLCEAYDVSILFRRGDRLRLVYLSGPIGGYPLGHEFALTRGYVMGRAVIDSKPVHIADLHAEAHEFPEGSTNAAELGHRTILAIPLLLADQAIGTIVLRRLEVDPFAPNQVALLQTFADQAVIAIENTRLFEAEQSRTKELQESLEYQTATSEVLGVISKSPDTLQPVLDGIVATALRLCDARNAAIVLHDGDVLRLRAKHGPMSMRTEWPVGNRSLLVSRAVHDCRTQHVHDLSSAGDEFPEGQRDAIRDGIRSILAVPLVREERSIGTIVVRRTEVKPFNDRQIALLQTFADQAVIAINNVGLFEEVQARTKEVQEALAHQTATMEVLNVISRSPTKLSPVFEAIVASAANLCGASASNIQLYDGRKLDVIATHNYTSETISLFRQMYPMAPSRSQAAGRAILTKGIVQIADVLVDAEYSEEMARVGRFRSILSVPMSRHGEPIGVISVSHYDPTPFTDRQIDLLKTFAEQAVIAIENTRLFEAEQASKRELTEALERQTATADVLGVISSSPGELEPVFRAVLASAVRICGANFGTLHRYDGNKFSPAAIHETPPALSAFQKGRGPFLPERGNALDRMLQSKMVVHVIDDAAEQVPSPAGKLGGARSLIAVPMLIEHELVGAIFVYRQEVRPFTDKQIDLVTNFARQAVIAIENTRLLNELRESLRQLEIASQHKSQFVANMSHELRTPLAAILGYAELIQEGFYGPLPDKSIDALTRIRSNGKHLLGLINTVLDIAKIESGQFKLNFAEYAMGNVVETVRAATESLAETKKLALKTAATTSLPIGFGDEQRLTQVLLNLVGNAIKFTDTGEVHITAGAVNGHFAVSVTDTGPGIPADQLTRVFEQFHQVDSSNTKAKGGTGLGLAISKQIVEMHGGRIWVESILGKGSSFHMELPVRSTIKGAA